MKRDAEILMIRKGDFKNKIKFLAIVILALTGAAIIVSASASVSQIVAEISEKSK